MHSPEPKDFGVNPKDIEWAEKIGRSSSLVGFVASAIACTYAWITFHIEFPLALLLFTPTMILLLIMTVALIRPSDLLLQLFMPRYRRAQRYRKALAMFRAWWVRTQKEFWLSLSGIQFEAELAGVFRKAGFRAELTAASGDKGVDIWLYTERGKEIVQCKAHSGPIGPAVVRELYGTLQHFGAPAAILASTSGFTKGVRAFARNKPIVLMDLSDIIALQERNPASNSRIGTQTRKAGPSQ
jgi:HJR/Mrr/RecB family endonuclease